MNRWGLLWLLCGLAVSACSSLPVATIAPSSADLTRVVVLDPGISEVFIDLNLVDKMVGRPQYTEHLTELGELAVVGTGITPNYEAIVRANPQFIFTHATRGKALTDLGLIAPTKSFTWLTIEDIARETRALGDLMGVPVEAAALAERVESAMQPQLTENSPRVLMLLGVPSKSSTELWYAKTESLHGAALEAAGGRNAVVAKYDGPPSLSIEALIEINPDVIVVLAADATEKTVAGQMEFWANLPMLSAVKENKIGFLTGREHFSTGPRVVAFRAVLATEVKRLWVRDE
jgi:ABC-type Fe3+-hydroxamate transport system substrate-binding protein